MTQTVAQSSVWTVTVGCHVTWGCERLDVLVNGMPYCIGDTPTNSLSITPASIQSNDVIPFDSNVYQGTCDNPGVLIGPIVGTIDLDLLESPNSGPFTAVLVFTVGPGLMDYHSEAKFTGYLQINDGQAALKNVVSEYASVRGTGLGGISLDLDLQLLSLEPETGDCTLVDEKVLWLPTFVFSVPSVAVGGLVIPTNTLALVAPWLAVIGLVGCIVVVVAKKRRP